MAVLLAGADFVVVFPGFVLSFVFPLLVTVLFVDLSLGVTLSVATVWGEVFPPVALVSVGFAGFFSFACLFGVFSVGVA